MNENGHKSDHRLPGIGLGNWTGTCMACKSREPDSLVELGSGNIWCRLCGFVFEPVRPEDGCPKCGERNCDALVWIDDERVRCERCHTIYSPGEEADDDKA